MDLYFAADVVESVGGIWATKTVEKAVTAARQAVAQQQLKMRRA